MSNKNLKIQKLKLLEQKLTLQENLPHIYGWKFYKWTREFYESTNRMNFLCAGNQLSKSSSAIRKAIHWATCKELWPKLWLNKPLTFWYLYPTKEIAHTEVTKKWIPEFLPRGELIDHPVYGWKVEKRDRWVWAIHFNSGVSIFFKTYAQDASHLQAGSVYAAFCDEELPYEIFPEIGRRLAATRGYFHMVFTATLGQVEWLDTIEGKGNREKFPKAAKWQISMYDCQEYEDGSKAPWTLERIHEEEESIGDKREIDKRIHGKFVLTGGLKYEGFDRVNNVKPPKELSEYMSWHVYAGVDIGSGGTAGSDIRRGHPAAIVFVAVRPDFKYGRVFRGWRGDFEQTTAGDVLNKYIELSQDLNVTQQFYDWHNKDFLLISLRAGMPFEPAEKGHETGETTINTLFKNGMMDIDDIPELEGLAGELSSLRKDAKKTTAKDDFSDGLRYAVTKIPWDFQAVREKICQDNVIRMPKKKKWVETCEQRLFRERMEYKRDISKSGKAITEIWEDEVAAWQELYEV